MAQEVVLPLYQHDDAGARLKGPGDWVTEADHRCEALLSAALPRLLPGSDVVGEEAVHADPELLGRLREPGPTWLIDPVDGTRNFVSGQGPFAIMVALLDGGRTVGGWIHLPLEGRTLAAQAGGGSTLHGPSGTGAGGPQPHRPLVGAIARDSLPPGLAESIAGALAAAGVALVPTWACSGRDYPSVVTGEWDFLLPWAVMPWDHAAGALITQEAGGRAARLDGSAYSPAGDIAPGLLVARSPAVWQQVRGILGSVL
jgi:fructose-1,6-bisphosphatase/inositol monophosphatase family enzyme